MDKVKNYIKNIGIGFYLLIPAVILSIVIPFVYMGAFSDQEKYWSLLVFFMPLIAIVAFATYFYKHTAKYTGIIMFALELAGLLLFISTIYYYIADVVFKAGEGANIIKAIGNDVMFIIVGFIINIVLCAVAAFFKPYKTANHTPAVAEEIDE